ncbi:unnamed protein product, partial [Meganyctiphanes norvegica]
MCPRVFHLKCAGMDKEPEEDWACSECHAIMQAENIENRSRAMLMISVEQLCTLLRFALNRLKSMPGMEPFTKPVDISEFPTYREMVVHPVDFISLERNIKRKFYGSTEAFSSDARWIAHNSVIFNGANSKVTAMAKSLVKILKQDMSEIETCPDCYLNAHQKPKTWFIEACRSAHPLIWARLKGFPFWPAKAVKLKDGSVDVRFFGRHDRSWVPVKECFLFSEQMPTPLKNRNKTLEQCLQEVSEHIVKLRERFGKFRYAPHRLHYNPNDPEQIKVILPNYKGHMLPRVRGHSRAFSRLSGHSDDETSSIASTDSGTSSIRRNRFSGASTTPETETEAEIQSEAASQGDNEHTQLGKSNDKVEKKVKDGIDKKDDDDDELEDVDLLLGLRNNNDINKGDDSKIEVDGSPASSLPTRDEDEEYEDEVPKGVMQDTDEDDDDEDDIEMTEEHLGSESEQLKLKLSSSKKVSENKDQPKDGDETSSDKQEKEKENKNDSTDRNENFGDSAGKEDGDDEKEKKDRKMNEDNEKENEIEKEEDEDEDDDEIDDNQMKDNEAKMFQFKLNRGIEKLQENLDVNKEKDLDEDATDNSEKNKESSKENELLKGATESKEKKDSTESKDNKESLNENIQKSNVESMECESSENSKEAFLKVKSLEIKDNPEIFKEIEETKPMDNQKEKAEKIKAIPEIFKEIDEVKDKDNQEEKSENRLENVEDHKEETENKLESVKSVDEATNPVSNKDDASIKLKDNDDKSKNSDKENNIKVDGSDYKRKYVEENRSSIIKSVNRTEVEQKPTSCSQSSTNFEKSNKESDSPKINCDSVRKIESFKGVSISSVIIESKNMDISEKDVDSNSEDEDKRDIEARRLKEDEDIRKEKKDKEDRDSLAEAVRLVQNMGGIAIKRLETKSPEADSSKEKNAVDSNDDSKKSEKRSSDNSESESDREGSSPSPARKSKMPEDKEVEQHISSLGGSVSVTRPVEKVDKEKEKEKDKEKKDVQMPSGVDTTRLSPSISIIAVTGTERSKPKTTMAPSTAGRSSTPSSGPSPSPSTENASAPSPRTPKVEAGIPPPPPLTHPQAPQAGPRGVFGPLPPGSGMLMGGGRGVHPMPGPGMRLMGPGGPMLPGGPMRGPPPRYLPPEAGPLSTQLHKHSQKLAEIMRATLEDVLGGLVGTGTPEARLAALQLELERTSWRHQQELAEVRHNADVMLQIVEMRRQMERQMVERISEVRRQLEAEKQRAIEETKKKQWCANCGKEALFFCCWNTS